METQGSFRKQKIRLEGDNEFVCKLCNFISTQKSHLKRHFKTEKHKRRERDELRTKRDKKLQGL